MSFFGSLTGSDAADASNSAAADTYAKQKKAWQAIQMYGDEYAGKFDDLSKRFDPYVNAGNSALERLTAGLGLGGNQEAFTQAYRGLPGYQAGLQTGSNAITTNAAARGMLHSGSALKALQKYGSDYEDRRVGDYMQRLAGLAGAGQTATGQQVGTIGTGLQGQLGTRQSAYGGMMQSAGTLGQGQIAGANAEAQGAQNIFNAAMNLGGKAIGMATGNPFAMMGGSSSANSGAPGGGYYGTNGSVYPGPGYYPR